MPFAASNPHFYGRFPNELTKKLEGFKPVREQHQSFIIVEPIMGIPIDQSARSQSNIIIPDLYGFNSEIERFSNMALPTFWVEYVSNLIVLTVDNGCEEDDSLLSIRSAVFVSAILNCLLDIVQQEIIVCGGARCRLDGNKSGK